ncbi:FIST signal transduction protein [Methylobacterium sp. ID0610]|uniref:FIST signal transduction protein n=1 Tax=Methylobacterium carpenticola TaxID=3344827 RepID=UPI00368A8B7F
MVNGGRGRAHLCGVQTAWSQKPRAEDAVAEIAAAIDGARVAQLLVFFSPSYGAAAVSAALAHRFPGVGVAGCTSSGEISPAGGLDRGLVVVAFPREGFRVVSAVLTGIERLDVEAAVASVRDLRMRLDRGGEGCAQRFAISLIDGLTLAEERVTSAVAFGLDAIPLVGGSAGDALTDANTALIHDGQVHHGAAILLIVGTDHPIEVFKTDNLEPRAVKFVVTQTDAGNRTVRELNAEPAAAEYARALGLQPEMLTPTVFAANPLAVRVGGDYFCRSIHRLNPDGSLSFLCAIDEGVVLTLAGRKDLVATTHDELARLDSALGGLDLVIGFDCVLRRLDAELHQVRHRLSDLYRRYNVIGFETRGEQYRAIHLNQTFTGIAIGAAPRA